VHTDHGRKWKTANNQAPWVSLDMQKPKPGEAEMWCPQSKTSVGASTKGIHKKLRTTENRIMTPWPEQKTGRTINVPHEKKGLETGKDCLSWEGVGTLKIQAEQKTTARKSSKYA